MSGNYGASSPEVMDAVKSIDNGTVPIGQETLVVFDAYYRAWKREGIEQERERIIALLEEQDYANGKAAHKENPLSVCNICRTIALIKGETE